MQIKIKQKISQQQVYINSLISKYICSNSNSKNNLIMINWYKSRIKVYTKERKKLPEKFKNYNLKLQKKIKIYIKIRKNISNKLFYIDLNKPNEN